MIDLMDVTKVVHYENYRCRQMMSRIAGAAAPLAAGETLVSFQLLYIAFNHQSIGKCLCPCSDPFTSLERDKRDHQEKVEQKRKELERIFAEKVKEKEAGIRDKQAKVVWHLCFFNDDAGSSSHFHSNPVLMVVSLVGTTRKKICRAVRGEESRFTVEETTTGRSEDGITSFGYNGQQRITPRRQ